MISMGDIGRLRQNVNVNKNAYGGKINVVYSDSLDYENETPEKSKKLFQSEKVITEQPINRYWDQILPMNCKSGWGKGKDGDPGKSDARKEFEEKAVKNEKPDLSEDKGYYCCT